MCAGGEMLDAVMKFARKSGIFETPNNPNEAITPALSTLTETQFVEVWREFHLALSVEGCTTEVLLNDMRDAETWRELAQFAFDGQKT